jgi:hypothetical protein
MICNEVGHYGCSDDGEKRGTECNDAHDPASVFDEPIAAKHESCHLEAHACAPDDEHGNKVQPIKPDSAIDFQSVCKGDSDTSHGGDENAGDKRFLDSVLNEASPVYQRKKDADQIPYGHW